MTFRTKISIAIGIAAIFAIGIIGGEAWSDRKITTLENQVEKARTEADSIQRSALGIEIEAAEYKHKIEYLEAQLTEIKNIARKQDDELKKTHNNSRNARGDVDRARRTRAVEATTAELCAKLAELGYACH